MRGLPAEFSEGVTQVMIEVRTAVHSLPYRNSCHYYKDDKLVGGMSSGAIMNKLNI
jgi:Leu/Phe-tRNA-protein transferase